MKKIYRLTGLAVLILLSAGCKDFLERAPSDRINKEEVFSQISTAEAYLNNAYTYLQDFQLKTEDLQGRYKLADCTDEGLYQNSASVTNIPTDIVLDNWNSSGFPGMRNWRDFYAQIRRCNMFMENYDMIPEEASSGGKSERKKRLLGEAYGLRGYYYFQLWKMWGGVPLFDHTVDIGDVNQTKGIKRATAEETFGFIISDLEKAIEILPEKHDDANFGRFTSVIAYSLIARAKIYWASPYWNRDNDVRRWEDAADAATEARIQAEKAGHTLAATYADLFNKIDVQNEVIWYKNSKWQESWWWDWYGYPLGYGAYNVDGPIQEFVDDFEMKVSGEIPVFGYTDDDKQILNPLATDYDPSHPWDNREERFYCTVLCHGQMLAGRAIDISYPDGLDQINIGNILRSNYFCNKYLNPNYNFTANTGRTYRRFAIIRTAELYLSEAEALTEVGGESNIAKAIELVNKIRKRANVNLITESMLENDVAIGREDIDTRIPVSNIQDALRSRIRHERRIELSYENHRFWDVRRWMIAPYVANGKVHKVSVDGATGEIQYEILQNRIFTDRGYLFPIPQVEIDKNNEIEQNPGWN